MLPRHSQTHRVTDLCCPGTQQHVVYSHIKLVTMTTVEVEQRLCFLYLHMQHTVYTAHYRSEYTIPADMKLSIVAIILCSVCGEESLPCLSRHKPSLTAAAVY